MGFNVCCRSGFRISCFLMRLLAAAGITLTAFAHANGEDELHVRPTLMINAKVLIKEHEITLGRIARLSNQYPEFEKLISQISAISLGEAPPPKTSVTVPGVKILSALEKAGIPLDAIGYSIPKAIVVEREGHAIEREELIDQVRRVLIKDPSLDLQIRDVVCTSLQVVPAGERTFEVERVGAAQGGKMPLRITAFVDNVPAARFLATAVVDDWREVPVLNKNLERGMLISPQDVEVVRLNLFKQPPGIADSLVSVIGRRVKQNLQAGETIQKAFIDIPPVIPKGKKVRMIFDNGPLQATAMGVATEDGFEKGEIAVRNESSRKVVRARVIDQERVEVGLQ